MSKFIRAFIAIELNKEIQQFLCNIQNDFKKLRPDVKWVRPENIHLTLRFLGNIDQEHINNIKNILIQTSQKHSIFDIELSDIGAFPKKEFPRVIWVGIGKNKDRLTRIAAELEEEIQKIGIPKESREFHPHITIGRVRSNLNRSCLIDKLKNAAITDKPLYLVERLTLFKSTLTPAGPIHEVLTQTSLKAT
jgi:2'-5' RNA ligase